MSECELESRHLVKLTFTPLDPGFAKNTFFGNCLWELLFMLAAHFFKHQFLCQNFTLGGGFEFFEHHRKAFEVKTNK